MEKKDEKLLALLDTYKRIDEFIKILDKEEKDLNNND